MKLEWKIAALAGGAGALAALIVVIGAGALGVVPGTGDAAIHRYLMNHPQVIYDMLARAQADDTAKQQSARQQAVAKLGAKAFFDPAVAYVTGPAGAKNTFVEFFDYNCVHCRNSFPAVKAFYEAHKTDTRFAFIEMPINGEASTEAARGAIAARAVGDAYLKLHFALMGADGAIDNAVFAAAAASLGLDPAKLAQAAAAPSVDKVIAAGHKLAESAQVGGTPSFVINGHAVEGEVTVAEIEKLLR
jgi:protein-disulfide isomerase